MKLILFLVGLFYINHVQAAELKPGTAACYGADGYISMDFNISETVKVTVQRWFLFSFEEPESNIFSFEVEFPKDWCHQNPKEPSVVSCIRKDRIGPAVIYKDFDGKVVAGPKDKITVDSFSTTKSLVTVADPQRTFTEYNFYLNYMQIFQYKDFKGSYADYKNGNEPCQFVFK